jgi:hypothetical protein
MTVIYNERVKLDPTQKNKDVVLDNILSKDSDEITSEERIILMNSLQGNVNNILDKYLKNIGIDNIDQLFKYLDEKFILSIDIKDCDYSDIMSYFINNYFEIERDSMLHHYHVLLHKKDHPTIKFFTSIRKIQSLEGNIEEEQYYHISLLDFMINPKVIVKAIREK